jgi:hypothetical protein
MVLLAATIVISGLLFEAFPGSRLARHSVLGTICRLHRSLNVSRLP